MDIENEDEAVEQPVGEVNNPSLGDAITAALDPLTPKPAEPEEPQEGEENADGEEGDTEGEPEEGEATGKRTRGPDGKFLPADDKGKTAGESAKPETKLGPDGKPVAPAKVDAVNDPIPEDVKGRTRERIQSLIGTVKEKDEQIAIQNQLVDSISSTGATPEEFGAMLGYMRWVHSDKPEDLRQAKELLLSELRGVSLKLGEAAPGIDFVAEHPDLLEKVNNGQITVEDATELAMNRTRTASQTAQQTAVREREQASQAATRERDSAIAELNELGNTLSQTDPDYARKHAILEPVLASLGQLEPKKWKQAFMNAYKAIPAAQASQAAAPTAPKPASQQPLRANKSPSGGQNRAPSSMLDAISAAIDSAGGQ